MEKLQVNNSHVIELKRGESYILILDSKQGYTQDDADTLSVQLEKMGIANTFILLKDADKGVTISKQKDEKTNKRA